MEINIEIPDGEYCGECMLLNPVMGFGYDYECLYLRHNSPKFLIAGSTKHPDCPSLLADTLVVHDGIDL